MLITPPILGLKFSVFKVVSECHRGIPPSFFLPLQGPEGNFPLPPTSEQLSPLFAFDPLRFSFHFRYISPSFVVEPLP